MAVTYKRVDGKPPQGAGVPDELVKVWQPDKGVAAAAGTKLQAMVTVRPLDGGSGVLALRPALESRGPVSPRQPEEARASFVSKVEDHLEGYQGPGRSRLMALAALLSERQVKVDELKQLTANRGRRALPTGGVRKR